MLVSDPRHQRGFSLIELLIVIGIIIALVAAVILFRPAIMNMAKSVQAAMRITSTAESLSQAFRTANGDYSTLSNTNAINGRWVPDAWVQGTNLQLRNEWGGAITLSSTNLDGGSNNAYQIVSASIPSSACSRIVESAGMGMETVTVGTTEVKAFGATTIAPGTLATACATANSVSITLVGR